MKTLFLILSALILSACSDAGEHPPLIDGAPAASSTAELIQTVSVSYGLNPSTQTPCANYPTPNTVSLNKSSPALQVWPYSLATWSNGTSLLVTCGFNSYPQTFIAGETFSINKNCTFAGRSFNQRFTGSLSSFLKTTIGSVVVTDLSNGCQNVFQTIVQRP